MKKGIHIIISMILAVAAVSVNAQTTLFYESFDQNDKYTGGNDGKWSGSVASGGTITTDNEDWTFEKGYGANCCVRLGNSNAAGSATTPKITELNGDALLTFNAGSWGTDGTSLELYISGGGTLDQTSITLSNSQFTTYSVNIEGGTSNTTIKFQGKGKRFFLDEVKIVSVPPAIPTHKVNSLAELRELEDGDLAYLTLGKSNPGLIEYVDNGSSVDAYVRDNTSSVRFASFLPDDAGWHTNTGGALIGGVLGEYHLSNGIPEFVHVDKSIADSILCLDHWHTPTPLAINDMTELNGIQHRADYVQLVGVGIANSSNNYYVESNGTTLPLSNPFGIGYEIPNDLKGRDFIIQGILGTTADGSQSELYYTNIEEIMPELTLNETLSTNGGTIGTYNGREVNVTVERKLSTGKWNTLCLPFDIQDFTSVVGAARLATLSGYDSASNSLEFTSVTDILPGVPYLVYPEEDIDNIIVSGATISSELTPVSEGAYTFIGVFDPTTLYAGDTNVLFLGADNKLYYPNVTNDLKAFHAYFITNTRNSANISIDGISSGITTASLNETSEGEMIYNVSGQSMGASIKSLPKGVYVRNGNKVIIK